MIHPLFSYKWCLIYFFFIYWHIGKGLFYSTYNWNSRLVWWSGYLIFILTVATSFLGYILPWGQMSYWGTTVISNLITVVPIFGERILLFLWGDHEVATTTLQRVFVLHYLLPFILLAIIVVHLICMHNVNVNSPQRWNSKYLLNDTKNIPLHPYYVIKDCAALLVVMLFMTIIICYYPERFGNPVNYIQANPEKTPKHIIPEWYFLPLYGILKVLPSKLLGIFVMIIFLVHPIILPFLSLVRIKFQQLYNPILIWNSYFTKVMLILGIIDVKICVWSTIYGIVGDILSEIEIFSNNFLLQTSIDNLSNINLFFCLEFKSTPVFWPFLGSVLLNESLNFSICLVIFFIFLENYLIAISSIIYSQVIKVSYYLDWYKYIYFIFISNFIILIDLGYWNSSIFFYRVGPLLIISYFILLLYLIFYQTNNKAY